MKSTLLLMSFFILYSCGASKLNTSDLNKSLVTSSSIQSSGCLCSSDFMPVCGADTKTYDNACLAQCFGNKSFNTGQCTCSQTMQVCGVDGIDYNECEALNKKIIISKYAPCSAKVL